MNKKILGIGFVVVILALSIWIFEETGKIESNDVAAPAIETSSNDSAETVLVSDSMNNKSAMNLPSKSIAPSDNQSAPTKESTRSKSPRNQETDFSNLLASEDKLIYKSGTRENPGKLYLNSLRVGPILSEDDVFHKSMKEFTTDQHGSPDAMDMTDVYRDIFEAYGESLTDETFNLQNFSCGHSICIGSVLTGNSDDMWADFLTHLETEGGIFRVFTENAISISEDIIEHRFFFSIDPNLVGIVVSEGG